MKVTLINYTQDAADLLIFTKSTRLTLSPTLLESIKCWPEETKLKELEYMSKTIKSSWEFVDVTFLIEGVSRATAQQITRTRTASYAMQSQRVNDMSDFDYVYSDNILNSPNSKVVVDECLKVIKNTYHNLIKIGQSPEDARGVLPMNVQCNLIAKYNLRSLSDVIKARKSLRAQGEYNQISNLMEQAVVEVWPWAEKFFKSDKQIAISMLEGIAIELGVITGKGAGWEIAKAIDLIRKD